MSNSSGDYRPFNDPKHPSWYSDGTESSTYEGGSAGQHSAGQPVPTQAQNPYAQQPLAGPYNSGQPQYPIDGQYPVVTNPGPGYGYENRQVGQPHPTVQQRPSSNLGLIAMICGIVGVVTGGALFLPQIGAIILGHIGLAKEPQGRGFSIAGLVMGYLVTGAWVLLFLLGMFVVAAG